MNTRINLLVVALFITALNLTAQQNDPKIMGTWRLISLKQNGVLKTDKDFDRIKLITKSNFSWSQYNLKTKIVRNSAGGVYKYNGKTYTEKINYVGLKVVNYLGDNAVFNVKIVGDKLYQTGKLPDNVKIEEVWKRVD